MDELRAELGRRLPEYMVPAAIMEIPCPPVDLQWQGGWPGPTTSDARHPALRAAASPGPKKHWPTSGKILHEAGARHGRNAHFLELEAAIPYWAHRSPRGCGRCCDVDLPLRRIFETPVLADLAREIDRRR